MNYLELLKLASPEAIVVGAALIVLAIGLTRRSTATWCTAFAAFGVFAARVALRQILELTDKQAESITGVERRENGWTVSIEVVEDRRIPSSADILATYETRLDGDGELMSYRRVSRFSRGRGDSKGS